MYMYMYMHVVYMYALMQAHAHTSLVTKGPKLTNPFDNNNQTS